MYIVIDLVITFAFNHASRVVLLSIERKSLSLNVLTHEKGYLKCPYYLKLKYVYDQYVSLGAYRSERSNLEANK